MKRAIIFLAVIFLAPALWAQHKYALVIGNSTYNGIPSLNSPVNDANDMEVELRSLGFNVTKVLNGSRSQIERAVTNLRQRIGTFRNSYGFFFYAGYGVHSNGENYLIPANTDIPNENALRNRAVSMQWLLTELSDARNELNVVVLDVCRDNPFSWSQGGTRGFTATSNIPSGNIVFYTTAGGRPAADETGRNGLLTAQLLEVIKTPGLEVTEMFRRTRAAVTQASGGAQVPVVYNQFSGTAFLGTRPSSAASTPAQPDTPPARPDSGFIRINGGVFQMGNRNVTLRSFSMNRYEVTQKEWFEVMGTTIRRQRDIANRTWSLYGEGDNYPMYYVNWLEAIEYCNRRSIKEGLTPVYQGSGNNVTCDWNANGYRLPTEAEWEYAARGGGRDPMMYEYSGSNDVDAVAWYSENSGGRTKPVGTKAPNSLGLYDMSGNVWEWCWDWQGNYPTEAQSNPRGAISGTSRVVRGGGWYYEARFVRTVYRGGYAPSYRDYNTGFRLVRNNTVTREQVTENR